MRISRSDSRTYEQIKRHYLIERELAGRLRSASRQERKHLYTSLYDEFTRRVPDHSQALREKARPEKRTKRVLREVRFISRFLTEDASFLEIGAGDCAVSAEVSRSVAKVVAIDVSHEAAANSSYPANLEWIISDGISVPVPDNSVNVTYSNQLMEHLHPDDAIDQLQSIYQSLVTGGVYICSTPNRLSGPHDVSRYFDREPTGFHLKEYSSSELEELFGKVGFAKTTIFCGGSRRYIKTPSVLVKLYESVFETLPFLLRQKLRAFFHSNFS